LNGVMLLLNIAGGVALLLWGARMVRKGITRTFGADIRLAMGRVTKNRFRAFSMGVGISALLQSSTGAMLLVVSFVNRGLISVGPGLALVLGADLGTTLVVQALSFDISWISPLFLFIGVLCALSSSRSFTRHIGRVFIGLGLLLLSLQLITAATEPLRNSPVLITFMEPLSEAPVFAIILAALLTWLCHSSVAVVLLIMSLVAVGVVPLNLGIVLVLGANIGSSITSFALTMNSEAKTRRIVLGNLIFRLCGVMIALPLMGPLVSLINYLDADASRQIANVHTLFNLLLAIVFLPFTELMATFTKRIYPEVDHAVGPIRQKYLDPSVLDSPSVAMVGATRELLRMADLVEDMLLGVIKVLDNDEKQQVEDISKIDDDVDALHEAVKLYLAQVSRNELDDKDSQRCIELISFTTSLEHNGDIIDNTLLDIARKKMEQKLSFSKEGWQDIKEVHKRVLDQMQISLSVLVSGDVETARRLLDAKEKFRDLDRVLGEQHLDRLRSGKVESIASSALHLDILRDFKRINSLLTSVAYPILSANGDLISSRLRKAGLHSETQPR